MQQTHGRESTGHTADTLVWTDRGLHTWTQIFEWHTQQERVNLLSRVDGRQTFEPLISLEIDPYDGPVYELNNDNIKLVVAPCHRLWCVVDRQQDTRQLVAAEDLLFGAKPIGFWLLGAHPTNQLSEFFMRAGIGRMVHYTGLLYSAELPGGLVLTRTRSLEGEPAREAVWCSSNGFSITT